MKTELRDEFVSLDGPFSKAPGGRFDEGGRPVMVRCKPYWVVRYVGGAPYSVLRDRRFPSEAAARAFAATLDLYAERS